MPKTAVLDFDNAVLLRDSTMDMGSEQKIAENAASMVAETRVEAQWPKSHHRAHHKNPIMSEFG